MPCGRLWQLPWHCSGGADRVRQWISLEATSQGRHQLRCNALYGQWHLALNLNSRPGCR